MRSQGTQPFVDILRRHSDNIHSHDITNLLSPNNSWLKNMRSHSEITFRTHSKVNERSLANGESLGIE
jgi:hypothetical protein